MSGINSEGITPRKARHFICQLLFFLSTAAFGQDLIISGTVIDEQGTPLPGVNVLFKGTARGTSSDVEGRYKISIPSGDDLVLVFSFIGYTTTEEPVNGRSIIDLRMKPDPIALSEVVVTGYSSIQKKDISSSIAVVDIKDMQKIAATNFADQLQGKVAGVQIGTSGDPGSFQFVRIRGFGSINNNEPLYVIDGVPIQNETNMNFLNPNDIESMQVLKDAAASSIYGARAANGVIVITTKRGKGKSKLNVDFFTGVQEPGKFPQSPSPEEQLQLALGSAAGAGIPYNSTFYVKDASNNWVLPDYYVAQNNQQFTGYMAGDPAVDPSKYHMNTDPLASYADNYSIVKANKQGTNWFKELFKPATSTRLDISASGASENGNYYFSAGYYDYNGIMIQNGYRRYQIRSNTSFNIRKNIRIGENLNVAYQKTKGPNANTPNGYEYSAYSAQIQQLFGAPTISPVYDINGYTAASIAGSPTNPVTMKVREADGIVDHLFRLTGNVFGEIDFLKFFNYRSNFGLDYNEGPFNIYIPTAPETGFNATNSLSNSWFNTKSWVWSNTANFTSAFGKHQVSALIGAELRDAYSESFAASGTTLRFDDPNYRTLSNVEQNYAISGAQSENKMASLFLNANYNYADKYLFSATVRRDGSSRFLNHKYGTFPAASLAWRISEESFLMGNNSVTNLKLRASYGLTGNNEVVGGDYPGYSNFIQSKTASYYDIKGTGGNNPVTGYFQNTTGNPDLKWESTIVTNIGVDATVFHNFDLTVEWYYRKTKDMIYGVTQPYEAGIIGPVNQNVGSMSNQGFDLQLNYRGSALTNKLVYKVGLTGTHYTNKVLALDADGTDVVPTQYTRTQAGYPVSQFYGYIADGLWQSEEQIKSELPNDNSTSAKPGRMRYLDVNKDGKIDADDRTFIGNPNPKYILGLSLAANYGRFDFTAFLTGEYGKQIYDPFRRDIIARDLLTEAGKTLPALDASDNVSYQQSSFYVEDGSYTRLRNLLIGYSFPSAVASKAKFSKARIYLQAQNLFTITHYSALDPGVSVGDIKNGNGARRDTNMGVDYGRYPWSRQFIIGFNLEF